MKYGILVSLTSMIAEADMKKWYDEEYEFEKDDADEDVSDDNDDKE